MTDEQRLVAGRYRLLSPLGSGGMGTVWRAEDVVLGREVAVKEVTFPHGLSDEDRDVLRERTRREARAAARLHHPSAVTVYDVVEENGSPFLVMELVEARTLSQVVRSDGPLSPRRTAEIGLALLGALETAHAQGIVHRDVKPGNVLLVEDAVGGGGRVVLTDFGIASSVGDSSITSTGLLLGSPAYIAPERARGQAPGPASDLWSLGATLFTAVEGRPPYDGGEPLLTVTAVVTGEHEPFIAAGPLAPVLAGLLERDPERRSTPAAVRSALESIAAAPSAGTPRAPVPATVADELRTEQTAALPLPEVAAATRAPSARRSRAPLAGLAAALVLAAGVTGFALSDRGADAPSPGADAPATAAPSAAAAALPPGWTDVTGPSGWTVGVPPSYDRSTYRGTQVQLRDDAARRTLRVRTIDRPGSSALAAAQAFSPQLAGALRDYRELSLQTVPFRGLDAADLEFTYRDSGADLHVVDRTVLAADGRAYGLYWQVRDADYAAALPVFEQIAATFRPAA